MNEFRDNFLKYTSFVFALLVPVIFWSYGLYPHIASKTFFIYGAVEVMFFVWLYSLVVDKTYRIGRGTLVRFIPICVFVTWMTVAGLLAISPGMSFLSTLGRGIGLIMFYHLIALAFMVSSLFKKYGWDYIFSLFKWSIVGSFILAISVWLGTEGFKLSMPVLKRDAGGGFSGNSTVAATYFLFTFVMSALLLHSKKLSSVFKKFIYITLTVIIFSPLFINLYGLFAGTGILGAARGTILALVSGIGATGVGYMFLSDKKVIKNSSIGIIIIGLITFSFLWIQLITPNTYVHNKFEEAARGSRFIFWNIAQKAMDDSPWFGYGPENYANVFQKYFDPQILLTSNSFEGWSDRAHNMYYDTGVAGGYPAIIFYALFVLSVFYAVYQKYKLNKFDRFQSAVFFGVFIAYIVNNIFTFESNITLVSIFLLLGLIYSFEVENNPKDRNIDSNKSYKDILAVVLMVLFLLAFIFLTWKPAMKSSLYAQTFASSLNKRPDMYSKLLTGSSIGSQWDISGISFDVYRKYVEDLRGTKSNATLLPHVIKDLNALIEHLKKVSETNKTDYRLYITIAYLQSTLKYYSDQPYDKTLAESQLSFLEQAKKLSPTNPNVYWSTAQVKVWAGDYKGAEEAYREGIRVAPNLPNSYTLMLTFAEVLGNKKLFEETMTEAMAQIPNFSRK